MMLKFLRITSAWLPLVNGPVMHLYVSDNELGKSGRTLVRH